MPELPMKRIALAAFAFCFGLLFVTLIVRHLGDRRGAAVQTAEHVYPQTKRLQAGFTLQNEANRVLERADLWVYGPVKQTATQRCDRIEASHPYELIADGLGNQMLHFNFMDLPPYAARIITIKAELSVSDEPNPTLGQGSEDAVRPERYIEADHPEVAQLAGSIPFDHARDRPRALFRWVAENIRGTGYTREDRGALDCLRRKAGDCTEQMYLFVALCRAAGIPARGVGGYVCEGDCVVKPNDYRNWAEFFQDGTWRLADPQKRVFKERPSRYVATRIIGAGGPQEETPMGAFHRFRFEGDGLRVRMNE